MLSYDGGIVPLAERSTSSTTMNLDNFFRNQFDTKVISDDHLNRYSEEHMALLGAVARFAPLVSATLTAHTGYFGALSSEAQKAAIQKSLTAAMDAKLEEFKDLASRHEGAVRSLWGEGSPEYLRFYPAGVTEYRLASLANVEEKMARYEQALGELGGQLAPAVVAAFVAPGDPNNLAVPRGVIVRFRAARAAQLQAKGLATTAKSAAHGSRDVLEVQLQINLLTVAIDGAGRTEAERAELLRLFPQHIIGNTSGGAGGGGGTPAVPPKGVVGSTDLGQDGNEHVTWQAPAGVTGTDVQIKGPSETEFTTVGANVPGNDFHLPALAAGDYELRLAWRNAAGLGEWSEAVVLTVP